MRKFAQILIGAALLILGLGNLAWAQSNPQTQCVTSALAGGTGDALTIPLLPCTGTTTLLVLKLSATNTTTTPTLQEIGYPALPVLLSSGADPAIGQLVAGTTVLLTNTGLNWTLFIGSNAVVESLTVGSTIVANATTGWVLSSTGGILQNVPLDMVDIKTGFGAKGDCHTDDSADFAMAWNSGLRIWLSPGYYLLNTAETYTTPGFMYGSGWTTEGLNEGNCAGAAGTYLVTTNSAISPITLSGAGPDGSQFSNFAVLQNHPAPGIGWAPTAYPPTFVLDGSSVPMTDVMFDNIGAGPVYDLIYAKGNAARIRIDNIWGQVFDHVFNVQQAMDTSSAHNWHIWPFWSTDANVLNWQYAHSVPFLFQRQDGYQADNIFLFGAEACLKFTANGIDNFPSIGVQFGNLWCDAGKYTFWIDSTAVGGSIGGVGLSISHLRGGGETAAGDVIVGSNTFLIDGNSATVIIGDILDNVRDQSIGKITNTIAGSTVDIGSITITGGYNYSGATPCIGTSPTFSVAPIAGNINTSQIQVTNFINPEGCGYNSYVSNNIQTSGLINTNATADVRVGADQNWLFKQLSSGATYAIPMWSQKLELYNPSDLATLTLDLPAGVIDGKNIEVYCGTNVASLTINPPAGQAIVGGGPPSCAINQKLEFYFNAQEANWWVGGGGGGGGGGGVTWPTTGDLVISNGTSSPAGLAPSGTNCVVSSGGSWTVGACTSTSAGGSSGNIQYNNSGAFGGAANFNYAGTAPQLTLSGTSGTVEFLISNSGALGSSLSEYVAATGTANAFILMSQSDGATPGGNIETGAADTNGLSIISLAGPITISPATNVNFPGLTASKPVCTDGSSNLVTTGCSVGTGTVTTLSVVTANGFAGTVANPTTTPAITLTTSLTATVVKANGTALVAASAGTDYVSPSGTFPAANLSGTTLASGVTASSLTSLGTVTALNFGTAVQGISGSLCYVSGCRNIIQDTSTSTLIGNSSVGIVSANTINPVSSNTYNLGSIATEWNNVYANLFIVGGTSGVTCSGAPTGSFASTNGLVTHC